MVFKVNRIGRVGYDQNIGVVVCAWTETEAREMAAENCGAEGRGPWVDPAYSTCTPISGNDRGVVLTSFRVG